MAKEKTSDLTVALTALSARLAVRYKNDWQGLASRNSNAEHLFKDATLRSDTIYFHQRLWQQLCKALISGQAEELARLCDNQGRLAARYGHNLTEVVQRSAKCIEGMIGITLREAENENAFLDNPRLFHGFVSFLNQLQGQLMVALISGFNDQQESGQVWPFVLPDQIPPPRLISEGIFDQLVNVTNEYTIARYRAGTSIFYEAEPQRTRFYFIREGTVQLQEFLADGRALTLTILGQGDVFARFAYQNQLGYFRDFQAEAMRDTEILMVEEAALERAMQRSPQVAASIIRSFSTQLATVHRLIQGLLGRDVTVRLAHLLIKLADQFGVVQPDKSILIDYSLSHQQLADMMGSNRVTVTRQLSELQKQGLLEIKRRSISLYNRPALEKLAVE